MPWGSLAATDWVSFTNIQGGGFTLRSGQSHVTSDDWVTKSEAIAKYYLKETNSFLSAKSANDWVAKRDLEVGDPATATLTVWYENNGWFAELSEPIPSTSVYISGGVARGYYDACLGAPDETVNMWIDGFKVDFNGFYIDPGDTLSENGYPYTPYEQFTGSVINYNMIDNVLINGTTRTNGSTFTIGGTSVTLSLPISCTPYS